MLHARLQNWLDNKGLQPFPFQQTCWAHIEAGQSGLLNAPTGSGKTYAVLLGFLNRFLQEGADSRHGLHLLWITPLKALAKDFHQGLESVLAGLMPQWRAGLRMGDTPTKERTAQKRAMPQILVTTPESLHLLISQKGHTDLFKHLQGVVVDEWHELLGSKRGVQTEHGLAHLRRIVPRPLQVWGVSATIGNMAQAQEVLLGTRRAKEAVSVRADVPKHYRVETVIPEHIDNFPWSGHLGLNMIGQVVPLLEEPRTCLVFTNTRAQAEMWYRGLLEAMPDLAGQSALHHGSLERDIRAWVEDALREGKVKVVVTTSSLDLGVDFSPVDRVVQIGSPKGVGRMLQRAGRSGHRPGATSELFLVPTNALEIVEFEALKEGMRAGDIESRPPVLYPLDVLIQYLMTLAIGDGFRLDEVRQELDDTYAYGHLDLDRLSWALHFLLHGGQALQQYDEYAKLEEPEPGFFKVESKRVAMRHRMSMGTIVSSASIRIKFVTGGYIGTVEETFLTSLQPGDTFWFAGRPLEFVQVKGLDMLVRKSKAKKGLVPRWGGGRMPLSSNLSDLLRRQLGRQGRHDDPADPLHAVQNLLDIQARWSLVPDASTFLVEHLADREGMHLFFYPFEGRAVHEILSSLVAWRIAQVYEATFSIAMNDYGFELACDQKLDPEDLLAIDLFSTDYLRQDLEQSINKTDMARRRFRDVATISGLLFTGMPGQRVKDKHLQSGSNLLYDVFRQYEPDNLLLGQAMDEVFNFEVEESRLVTTLERIQRQKLVLKKLQRPTPFAFPILTDALREKLSGETLDNRIRRMLESLEKAAAGKAEA